MRPYYEDASCVIYHADCQEILPALSDVDLFFTSPPYNLAGDMESRRSSRVTLGGGGERNTGYASYDDGLPLAEYMDWQRECLDLMWSALSDAGAVFYNHKPRAKGSTVWLPTSIAPHLPLRQIVTWHRQLGAGCDVAHFSSVYEWVLVYAKQDWRLKSRVASSVSDVWTLQPEMKRLGHPCPFPVGLPARAIEATSARLVVDPFMGTGATLRAAKDLGRRTIGIEIEERYCEIAANRLSQEVLAV